MSLVPTGPHLPTCPLVEQGFEDQRPKMVFAHNLDHMAPFRILKAGFWMFLFFPPAFLFVFGLRDNLLNLARGQHLDQGFANFGSGWPGEFLGLKYW